MHREGFGGRAEMRHVLVITLARMHKGRAAMTPMPRTVEEAVVEQGADCLGAGRVCRSSVGVRAPG
jgi:hypothetical protein